MLEGKLKMQNIEITNNEISYIIALCNSELIFLKDYMRNITTGVSTSTSYLDDMSTEDVGDRLRILQGFMDKIERVYESAV